MQDENEIEEKEPILEEPQDAVSRAARWFEGLKSGHTITVTRLKPTWCQGYLEKLYYVDGEPLDVDYLIRQWGGELLRLQVRNANGAYVSQCDVPLYSFAPRARGQLLQGPQTEQERGLPRHEIAQAPVMQAPAQSPLDTASGLAALLNQLSQSQQQSLKGYIDFLNRNSQPQTSGLGGLEQIVQVAKVYQQLQSIFGNAGPSVPPPIGDGENAFLPYIADIVKTVLNKEPGKKRAPIVGPRQAPLMPQVVAPQSPQVVSGIEELAKTISKLPPKDAAEVVAGAFGMMPEEQRNIAVPRFMEIITGEEIEEYQDDDEDDDDEDDEPEQAK